ncbi:MAG: hypothetical protein AAF589_02450 [Planctomycetota bacterium]
MTATLRLPIDGPYDLDATLLTLTMGTGNPCLRHDTRRAAMTLTTPDGRVAIRAERAADALLVATEGPGAEWIEPRLPGVLGLNDDAAAFQPEGRLGRLAKQHAGIHLPTLPMVFPRLVQVVLQQLISFRDACRGWRRLVQTYGEAAGESLVGGEELFHTPPAERIARLATSEFAACDILPKHGRVIRELARQAAGLERLWGAGESDDGVDRLCDYLLRQPGVGPWTVGYLRGAGLGDADAVVPGDYGHPHHVASFFTGAQRSDDAEMLRLLEPYRPHRFRVLMLLIRGFPPPPRRGPRRASLRSRLR